MFEECYHVVKLSEPNESLGFANIGEKNITMWCECPGDKPKTKTKASVTITPKDFVALHKWMGERIDFLQKCSDTDKDNKK